ncbi:MAG TPA: PAS domain S-box protein [Candidatus Binatia bacterium]|jgi:PAS domain S-box-containing protein|nr:PAS domain S-box protein [Candidatus Binatia bacterium]
MPALLKALIIEDSVDDTFFIVHELRRGGFQVSFERVETAAAMQAALKRQDWQIIISDYFLPFFSGAAALKLYQQHDLDASFIIVSGAIGEERAVEIIKAGAHDWVMKDNLARLVPVVTRELEASRDRSSRKQTEAVAAYLASLVESSDDAIIGTTLAGTVVSWNAGAQRLYGYAAAEIHSRSIATLIPRERPDELPEIMPKIQNDQPVEPFETVRVRKDGTKIEVSLHLSPIKDRRGRVIGVSTVARDITQHKRQEAERLALIQDLTSALARVNNLESAQNAGPSWEQRSNLLRPSEQPVPVDESRSDGFNA